MYTLQPVFGAINGYLIIDEQGHEVASMTSPCGDPADAQARIEQLVAAANRFISA
ncbi:MAG: hypothetical protein OEY86_07620 [Nitrospira sp.]|nr:hypothetical protein [Nitrospira sp.]